MTRGGLLSGTAIDPSFPRRRSRASAINSPLRREAGSVAADSCRSGFVGPVRFVRSLFITHSFLKEFATPLTPLTPKIETGFSATEDHLSPYLDFSSPHFSGSEVSEVSEGARAVWRMT